MLAESLPFGLTPEIVIVVMAALTAGVTLFAVWHALVMRDPLGPRLKMLADRRKGLRAAALAPLNKQRGERRRAKGVGFMRRFTGRMTNLRSRQADKLQNYLATAGFRSTDGPVVFMFLKALLPVIFGAAAVIALYVLKVYDMPAMSRLAGTIMIAALGFYAPDIYVSNAANKRRKALRKGLPDALDLLVICAEAGLGLDAALSRVTREMARSSPEIADEFGLASIELSFLPERRQALINLNERTNMAEIRGVVNTLLQSEKYGTPLAQSLRVLAAEYRNERLMRAETKAARLPAILTVPMIIFILPCLFVVLLGPAILRTIDALSGVTFPG